MGYQTDFNLTHDNETIDDEELSNELSNLTGYTWDRGLELNGAKWYDWKEDMRKLSLNHPGTLFTLEGFGEEQGDQWRAYFKSGKQQIECAVITFAPYDESKLK